MAKYSSKDMDKGFCKKEMGYGTKKVGNQSPGPSSKGSNVAYVNNPDGIGPKKIKSEKRKLGAMDHVEGKVGK